MYWMWGPIDEDNVQFDLEQDGEASLKKEQAVEDFEEVNVVAEGQKVHEYHDAARVYLINRRKRWWFVELRCFGHMPHPLATW